MTISMFITALAQFLMLAIIIRSLLTWFPSSRTLAPVSAVLIEATDPLLRPIQRRLPAMGGFDFSPLVAIFLIGVTQSILVGALGGH